MNNNQQGKVADNLVNNKIIDLADNVKNSNADVNEIIKLLNFCKEHETRKWIDKICEANFYNNYCRALYDYCQKVLIAPKLLIPGTIQYNKIFLKKEDEKYSEVEEIVDYLKRSLNYSQKLYDKSLNLTYSSTVQKSINKQHASILRTLGVIHMFYVDVEKGIDYLEKAVKFNSKYALQILVYIYLQDDYYNIDRCYECYQTLRNDYKTSSETLAATITMFYYYFNHGLYQNAKECIEDYKTNVFPFLNNKENEKTAAEVLKELENEINNINKKTAADAALKQYFSELTLSKMPEYVKVFIFTSLELKKYIDEQLKNDVVLDYSGATMPVMKALEAILFEIFANSYLAYLNSLKDINLKLINRNFKYEDKSTKTTKLKNSLERLECGDALYLACDIKRAFSQNGDNYECEIVDVIPVKYFADFCKEVCGINNPEEIIKEFANRLIVIKDLRNNSAHKNRIDKKEADKVSEYLIENYKFINFLYEKFNKIF